MAFKLRERFVDKLTCKEVALFVGVSPKTILRRHKDIGDQNSVGHWFWTVEAACAIYIERNGRKPTALDVMMLLLDMGLDDSDLAEVIILKLFSKNLVFNVDPTNKDIK